MFSKAQPRVRDLNLSLCFLTGMRNRWTWVDVSECLIANEPHAEEADGSGHSLREYNIL